MVTLGLLGILMSIARSRRLMLELTGGTLEGGACSARFQDRCFSSHVF